MEKTKYSFGTNLRNAIKSKGMTYGKAADVLDISLSFLNQLMRGESGPSLEMIYKLITRLNVPAGTLFSGDELLNIANTKLQDIPNDTLKLITEMSVKAAKDLDSKNTLSNEEQELIDILRGVSDKDRRRVIVDTARRLANVKNRQVTVRRMKAR